MDMKHTHTLTFSGFEMAKSFNEITNFQLLFSRVKPNVESIDWFLLRTVVQNSNKRHSHVIHFSTKSFSPYFPFFSLMLLHRSCQWCGSCPPISGTRPEILSTALARCCRRGSFSVDSLTRFSEKQNVKMGDKQAGSVMDGGVGVGKIKQSSGHTDFHFPLKSTLIPF